MGKKENLPKNIKFIKGNILNYDTCKKACKNQDAVIHLAAKVSIRNSINTLKEDLNINLVGTINVLRASSKFKIKNLFLQAQWQFIKNQKIKSHLKNMTI